LLGFFFLLGLLPEEDVFELVLGRRAVCVDDGCADGGRNEPILELGTSCGMADMVASAGRSCDVAVLEGTLAMADLN
jgi:hypothetical protein